MEFTITVKLTDRQIALCKQLGLPNQKDMDLNQVLWLAVILAHGIRKALVTK